MEERALTLSARINSGGVTEECLEEQVERCTFEQSCCRQSERREKRNAAAGLEWRSFEHSCSLDLLGEESLS